MSTAPELAPFTTLSPTAQDLLDLAETLNPDAFVALLLPDGVLVHVNAPALAFIGTTLESVLDAPLPTRPGGRAANPPGAVCGVPSNWRGAAQRHASRSGHRVPMAHGIPATSSCCRSPIPGARWCS